MEDLEKYREMGKKLFDKLKLFTYPIAIKMIKKGDEMPKGKFFRPHEYFGDWVPTCTAHITTRTSGLSLYIEGADIECCPSSYLYYGLDECENHPEPIYEGWARYGGFKKDLAAEHSSRANDYTFAPGELQGFITSPLNDTLVKPDVVLIFCFPVSLGHLILSATYEGDCINSDFNGYEASCKGVVKTYKTDQCNIGCPGYGDHCVGIASDFETIFFIPESKLEMVVNNLFESGHKEGPGGRGVTGIESEDARGVFSFPNAHPTVGPMQVFGKSFNPPQHKYTRRRDKNKKYPGI